ncbi:hypothetical protein AB5I41_08945 [Sphingomonas sp. MMS24-JH45]
MTVTGVPLRRHEARRGKTIMTTRLWLIGAAPIALFAASAHAQDIAPLPSATQAASDAEAGAGGTGGDIVVLGFGQTRQVQTISSIDMERLHRAPRR